MPHRAAELAHFLAKLPVVERKRGLASVLIILSAVDDESECELTNLASDLVGQAEKADDEIYWADVRVCHERD
jgi:hypothetical protein